MKPLPTSNLNQSNWQKRAKLCLQCRPIRRLITWKCRKCGAPCCEHLCALKDGTLAMCGACRRGENGTEA